MFHRLSNLALFNGLAESTMSLLRTEGKETTGEILCWTLLLIAEQLGFDSLWDTKTLKGVFKFTISNSSWGSASGCASRSIELSLLLANLFYLRRCVHVIKDWSKWSEHNTECFEGLNSGTQYLSHTTSRKASLGNVWNEIDFLLLFDLQLAALQLGGISIFTKQRECETSPLELQRNC